MNKHPIGILTVLLFTAISAGCDPGYRRTLHVRIPPGDAEAKARLLEVVDAVAVRHGLHRDEHQDPDKFLGYWHMPLGGGSVMIFALEPRPSSGEIEVVFATFIIPIEGGIAEIYEDLLQSLWANFVVEGDG